MIRQSLSRLCGRARVRSSDPIRSTRRTPSTAQAVLATLEPLELRRLLSGTAYTQALQINETGGTAGNLFGQALATHGSQALIASPGAVVAGNTNTGVVYLVDTTDGTVLHTFTDPDSTTFDQFGASAAFIGDRIAIGATSPNAADNDRIFLYQSADDASPIEIVAPDTADGSSLNGFAASLTTDGTYLYAGQSQTIDHPNGAVFEYDGGSTSPLHTYAVPATYSNTNAISIAANDTFVYATAVDPAATAPVVLAFNKSTGAYDHSIAERSALSDPNGPKLGVAPNGDIFLAGSDQVDQVNPSGTFLRTYNAPQVEIGGVLQSVPESFGFSMAFNDQSQVIIGAKDVPIVDDPVNTTAATTIGAAYVFDYTDGSLVGTIQQTTDFNTAVPGQLGTAVAALPDGKVLVSDPSAGGGAGAVYVYAPASSNTAPSNVVITGQADAARLQTISFAGTFSDADAGEAHTFSWDFGDGSTPDTSGLNVTHAFATEGTYTVTLTVTDSHQASASGTFVVNVTANSLQGNILYVGGTSGADSITIGTSSTGAVTINGTVYAGANSVVTYGGGGNDNVTAYSAPASTTLEIYGGAGDDSLFAGGANDIIVGGDGNDLITGGKGRDILIGGWGSDTINGDQNDDILIAGYTDYDNDPAALEGIFAVWNSTDSYDTRVAQLENGALEANVHVFDDGIADTLKGCAGTDFFSFNVDQDTADVKQFEDSTTTTTTTTDPALLP